MLNHPDLLRRFHAMDLFAVFALVMAGGRQVPLASGAADPSVVASALARFCVTSTALAPTTVRLLLAHLLADDDDTNHGGGGGGGGGGAMMMTGTTPPPPPLLPSLRLVSTGGQLLSAGVVRRFNRGFPHVTFFNDYGMTEAGGKLCVTLFGPPGRGVEGPMETRYEALSRERRLQLLCTTGRPFAAAEASKLTPD